MKPSLELGIKGKATNALNADLNVGARAKSIQSKPSGSIQGTHYDPTAAVADRGTIKKRPAPVV